MKQSKHYLKDVLLNSGALVLNDIEASLHKHLAPHFKWEWRSVVGDNRYEPPMWSLHIYVESKDVS